MAQKVMMKSSKYGINLILDPNIAFEDLLKAVIEKFKESGKFFKNSKMGISFTGRRLSAKEEQLIIEAITEHTSIEILFIADDSEDADEKMKRQMEAYLQLEAYARAAQTQVMEVQAVDNQAVGTQPFEVQQAAAQQTMLQSAKNMTSQGEFYRGTLRSGQVLESDASITILGDVNPGAIVSSGGNIVVLGALKGNACAGIYGDDKCFILALEMDPIQIQIGGLIAKSPDKEKEKKKRRLVIREKKDTNNELQIALARDGNIYIEPVSKKILNKI